MNILRGPAASRLLQSFGIHPKHYWLLLDLFQQLAERREIMSHLGRDGVTLKTASWLYFALSAVMSIAAVLTHPQLSAYLAVSLGFTAFLLLSILLSETSNSLVNPVEGLVLAHQPITGATYTAAKLTHLLRILLYLVPGLSVAPAIAALYLDDTPLYYPFLHVLAAFLLGTVAALLCCAVFGWLMRFVPAPRLKSVGQLAEMLPWVTLSALQFSRVTFRNTFHQTRLALDPQLRWPLVLAMAALGVAAVVLGIRSLSGDYLIRVAGIVHGRATTRPPHGRSWLGDLVGRLCGGPGSRAGFTYVASMMRRDWQFRRQLIPMAPSIVVMIALIAGGVRTPPFSGRFTPLHLAPHLCGFILFMICSVLVHGSDRKGTWLFLLAPSTVFAPFARGVHALLWIFVVLLPHAVLLPLLMWYWGIVQASLFVGYSLAIGSTYLALELRLIDGLPFSKEVQTNRGMMMLPIMAAGVLAIGIMVGLQYVLLFRSRAVLMIATAVIAAAAWFLTRTSLRAFEESIRFNLGLITEESKAFYQEVDA